MKHTILVVGASGTVGSQIVKNLKAQGHKVREATGKKEISGDQVHINLFTGEGRAEAFQGVDRAFFLSPSGYTDQYAILAPLIEQAKKNRLQKVVLMTAMGANANDEIPLRKAEIALEKSGLSYNIIRPNWFFQNFNTFWLHDIRTQGKILLPAGTAKASFIDVRDIADVATKLLVTDEFNNRDFDLTGPEAIDHSVVAHAISEVSGKRIGYQEVTPSELKSNLLKLGVSDDYADLLNVLLDYFRAGYAAPVTDAVQKITGQKPRSLAQYAQDYKKNWL